MYLRQQRHNAQGDRVFPSLGGRRTYEQASGSRATGVGAHQHFPVHLVPDASDLIVNQSLSFALLNCSPGDS